MFADISAFQSLCYDSCGVGVFNSAAKGLMMKYNGFSVGYNYCEQFIGMMQGKEDVPADLISRLYDAREDYKKSMSDTEAEIKEQAAKEVVDQADIAYLRGLDPTTASRLKDILITGNRELQASMMTQLEQTRQMGLGDNAGMDAGMDTGMGGDLTPGVAGPVDTENPIESNAETLFGSPAAGAGDVRAFE